MSGALAAETEQLRWVGISNSGVGALISTRQKLKFNYSFHLLHADVKKGCISSVECVGSNHVIISSNHLGLAALTPGLNNEKTEDKNIFQEEHN